MSPSKLIIAAAVLIAAAFTSTEAFARPGDRHGGGRRPGESPRVDDHRDHAGPVTRGHGHRGPEAGRGHRRPHQGDRYHGHRPRFLPGHYVTRTRQVWIPAFYRSEYVPPVYRTRLRHHGRVLRRKLVCAGYTRQVLVPGHYENRTEQVWVAGCWSRCR